jgi:hypothetical protein
LLPDSLRVYPEIARFRFEALGFVVLFSWNLTRFSKYQLVSEGTAVSDAGADVPGICASLMREAGWRHDSHMYRPEHLFEPLRRLLHLRTSKRVQA